MKIIHPDTSGGYFTKVPNDLIENEILTPAQKITWMQIASVCRGYDCDIPGGVKGIAQKLKVPYFTFIKSVKRLQAVGGAIVDRNECHLLIPTERVLLDEEADEPCVAEKVAKEPPRKPSGVSQKESMKQIEEAWNQHKPDSFMLMDSRMHLSAFIAVETQAKRLKVERPDYPEMIERILAACKTNDWYKGKTLKIHNLFGWGTDIEDKKFQNIEKLYKDGKSAVKFSFADDKAVLKWYNEAWPEYSWDKVERLTLPTVDEVYDHDTSTQKGGTVYVYYAEEMYEGKAVFYWTGQMLNRKLRYTPA